MIDQLEPKCFFKDAMHSSLTTSVSHPPAMGAGPKEWLSEVLATSLVF